MTRHYTRILSKKGMELRWGFKKRIHFEMRAPTVGWVAVGFNTVRQLPSSMLIMGAVYPDGSVMVQDHVIVAIGEHKARTALGLASRLGPVAGEQTRNLTTVQFSLPTEATDDLSLPLEMGLDYHLILAYSVDRDFQHHSRVRIWERITL